MAKKQDDERQSSEIADNENEQYKPQSMEELIYCEDPQEIFFHITKAYPQVAKKGIRTFEKRKNSIIKSIICDTSKMELSPIQTVLLQTNGGLLSAISCLSLESLMFVTGVWTTDDLKIYNHYNMKSAHLLIEPINKQFYNRKINARIEPISVSMPFERVIDYAKAEGMIFTHNQDMLHCVSELKKDLSIFALGFMNLQCRAYNFKDGTPRIQDWSKNKTFREIEENVLYNSFLLGYHLMQKRHEDEQRKLTQDESSVPESYEKMCILANALAANRLLETSYNLGLSARICLLDEPEQFVQIAMMNRFISKHLGEYRLMDSLNREATLYHVIRETRQAVQDCYQDDPDMKQMILSWYNSCTIPIEAKLSPEIRETKICVQKGNNKGKRLPNQGMER